MLYFHTIQTVLVTIWQLPKCKTNSILYIVYGYYFPKDCYQAKLKYILTWGSSQPVFDKRSCRLEKGVYAGHQWQEPGIGQCAEWHEPQSVDGEWCACEWWQGHSCQREVSLQWEDSKRTLSIRPAPHLPPEPPGSCGSILNPQHQ